MNRFCGACGMLLPDAARYCPRCGAVATQPPLGPAPRPRRSRVGMALGGFGMALLIIVAVFVVRGVRGTSAGAASPDDLVTRMAGAMTGVDPAAALDLLDPEELPGLRDLYETAVDQVREGADVDVPGMAEALRVTVEDVDHDVEYLDAEKKFAKVSFHSGRVSYDVDPERLPTRVREELESDGEPLEADSGVGDLAELAVMSDNGDMIDPFLVLVSHDGRWFVSLSLTVGEYLVQTMALPAGRYDAVDDVAAPAESPEALIRTLLDAGQDAVNGGEPDVAALSGLVPEAQTRAVRVYENSFRGLWDDEMDAGEPGEWWDDDCTGCGITYDGLQVSPRRNGSMTYAVLDALDITATSEICDYSYDYYSYDYDYSYDDSASCTTERVELQWDGSCLDVDVSYSPMVSFVDEEHDTVCLSDELDEDTGLTLADFGITDVHFVVTQERGGWVLDPVATIMDYGTTALSHLSDEKVKQALSD